MSPKTPLVLTDLVGKSIKFSAVPSVVADYAQAQATWNGMTFDLGADSWAVILHRFKAGLVSFIELQAAPDGSQQNSADFRAIDDGLIYTEWKWGECANFMNLMGPHSSWYIEKRRATQGKLLVLVGSQCDLWLEFRLDVALARQWLEHFED